MRRMLLSALFLFLSFPHAGCYSQNPGPAAEDKGGDPYTYDFGRVKKGEVLRHDFVLTNTSQKELTIKDVNTSCGCTVSKIRKNKFAPGESGSVEVSVDTKGYNGPIRQFVYVHTDSLDNPIIRFIIKAEALENKQGG